MLPVSGSAVMADLGIEVKKHEAGQRKERNQKEMIWKNAVDMPVPDHWTFLASDHDRYARQLTS